MTLDGVFLTAVLRLAISLLIALLGVLVLWRGRRLPWLFSGAASFLLGIMAVRFLDPVLRGRLTDANGLAWGDLVPIIAAVLGVLAGRYRLDIAYAVIGLATGGALAIWLVHTFFQPDASITYWSTIPVLLVMGMGMLFVLRYGEVALIVLSSVVGASLVVNGLSLPDDSSLVAALGLAASIAGLVIQYHDYLAELRLAHNNTRAYEINEPSATAPPAADGAIVPAK